MQYLSGATLIELATSAAAQPANIVAAGPMLMGCRALVENAPTGDMMQMGACAGAVSSAMDISRLLRRSCPPANLDALAAVRRAIMFVDERPECKADQFGPLVLTALADRLPC